MSGGILDQIDRTVRDYDVSRDAMRQAPVRPSSFDTDAHLTRLQIRLTAGLRSSLASFGPLGMALKTVAVQVGERWQVVEFSEPPPRLLHMARPVGLPINGQEYRLRRRGR